MAIVKLNRKEFEKKINLTEEIKEKIALFGTPLESVSDDEIEIEVFPNRPDLLSFHGFMRAFLAFLGKEKHREYKIHKPEKNFLVKVDKSVKDIRPYTACAIVKGIKFNDEKIKEIIDIQEKLHMTIGRNRKKAAIGIYPLEKISLPIKYRAESPDKIKFIPLEMDRELTGKQILSRHPIGRRYGDLLKGLKKYPIFEDARKNILSMPPIINSQLTGKISEKTEDIFIECSGFDLEVLEKTLNILVIALADMGGKIYGMELDYGKKVLTPDLNMEKMKINIDNINKLLGLELKEKEIEKLLKKMGHSYSRGFVEFPKYRVDILHEVDIAEDIAIAYGYDKFNPQIPEISTIGKEKEIEIKKRKIAEILIGLGMLEISSYHLVRKDDAKMSGFKNDLIEVENPKTDYTCLRPSLLVSAFKILSENVGAKYPQKIFELGRIFENLKEKEKLSIIIAGDTDFTDIKQILDYLFRMLNIKYAIKESKHNSFIEGRTASITAEGKDMGILGEVHPKILSGFGIEMPCSALELDLGFF